MAGYHVRCVCERRPRFLWANQAWCGTAFGISVAFRMSTNSVPSLVRVLCAVIENETGYRRLSRFPAQSPALQRLAKKNGTWDLAQTRSDLALTTGRHPKGNPGGEAYREQVRFSGIILGKSPDRPKSEPALGDPI